MDHQDLRRPHSSGGQEGHGVLVCHNCGWPFPNPHPSAKHRRAHKKICGTVEGYKVAGSAQLTVSDDDPETPIAVNLPEKIIKNIISRLPVKSLVRFTSVSKGWLSTILFDPDFTTQLRRNKTLTRRLLVYSRKGNPSKLKSRNSDMKAFKKVNFPFQGRFVTLLGSCNGLVFAVDENDVHSFRVHVWNPLTGVVKELPHPGVTTDFDLELRAYGVGYLPETDEYKVILNYSKADVELDVDAETEEEYNRRVEEDKKLNFSKILSLKDQIWRCIEAPEYCYYSHQQGTLVNESLHWLKLPLSYEIAAFDLAREEFREIGMPNFGPKKIRDLSELRFCFVGRLGGCLSVLRYPAMDPCHSVDFWVMREYGVVESWTKLFTLTFSNPQWSMKPLWITENSIFALKWNVDIWSGNSSTGVRISYKREGKAEPSVDILGGNWDNVIEYEESLASIGGHNEVHHNASQS